MNQKQGPEESSLWPSHKTGQSKSLLRLNCKKSFEKISESLKSQGKQRVKKQTSLKSLKSSKFDTPEKKNSPKPLRDFHKSPASKLTTCSTPFPSNIQLFSKKNIGKLINNSKLKSKGTLKFNPMHLAPVLNTRKLKEFEKSEKIQNFGDLVQDKSTDPELDQDLKDEIIIEYIETEQDAEVKEKGEREVGESKLEHQEKNEESKDEDPKTLTKPSKFLFYSKVAQPSFGEEFEDDPAFLSDRMSYECESNQSPKFDNPAVRTDHWELVGKKLERLEKLDSETQTECDTLEGILGFLNDHDIQTGIRFIAKIAKFVQTLK